MRPLALHNVLVASDLSADCLPALRTAAQLAALADARVHVVHVGDEPGTERALHEHLASAGLSAPVADARFLQGLPGATIAQEAWRTEADVIMLGPHRADGPTPLGSTADRVVRAVAAPCLILKEPLTLPLKRVLVAVDIADGARGILAVAMTWASALRRRGTSGGPRTTLAALHVIPPESDDAEGLAALEGEVRLVRDHLVDLAGVDVQQTLEQGADPANAILQRAEADSCDLVVLGTRGRTDPRGAPLGSVSSAVVSRANLPILLIPSALWKSAELDPLP